MEKVRTAGTGVCASCGQTIGGNRRVEQLLAKLGITEEMIGNLKSSFEEIDVEEYLDTARQYLKRGTKKATKYARDNPVKVAAGAVILAAGVALLITALNRD